MIDIINKIATEVQVAEEAANSDVFGALGIDWQVLLLQMVGFVLLVLILAKFIYPQIAGMLDRRDAALDAAMKAAKESEANAAKSEAETAKALAKARAEAAEIVDIAKKESADMASNAEFEAKKKAESIVRAAQADLNKDVEAARRALREETLDLVATATEKIAGAKLSGEDEQAVEEVLKGQK